MLAECYSQWLNPHSRGSWCPLFILEGAVVLLNMDRCSCCCLETKEGPRSLCRPSSFKPVPRRSACASITYTWMIKCRPRCCGSDNGDQVVGRLVRQRTNLKSNEKCFSDSCIEYLCYQDVRAVDQLGATLAVRRRRDAVDERVGSRERKKQVSLWMVTFYSGASSRSRAVKYSWLRCVLKIRLISTPSLFSSSASLLSFSEEQHKHVISHVRCSPSGSECNTTRLYLESQTASNTIIHY